MATHQIPLGSLVFPLDGVDTLDTVTVTLSDRSEGVRFPRLWQTPDGQIDLNDVLQGMIDQREDPVRLWQQVRAYYVCLLVCINLILSKLRAALAAFEAHDDELAHIILATLTPAERAYMEEKRLEMLVEHPEWALADIWDVDVWDVDVWDADEDSYHD